MIIEEAVLNQTIRVRCGRIPFLIHLDYENKSKCQITRISEGSDTVPYVKLILDRETWESARELKEFIDSKFNLLPVESDREDLKRNGLRINRAGKIVRKYILKDKPCIKCGKVFSPKGTKTTVCPQCHQELG